MFLCYSFVVIIISFFDGQGFVSLAQSEFHAQLNFRSYKSYVSITDHICKVVVRCLSFLCDPAYSKPVYNGVSFVFHSINHNSQVFQ